MTKRAEETQSLRLQLIGESTLVIRGERFDVHYSNPPLADGSIYNLDASARKEKRTAHLEPHVLRGVLGGELPPGLSITINSPKASLRDIKWASFDHLKSGPSVSLTIGLDYADWHLPLNLSEFTEKLAAIIRSKHPAMREVGIHETEVGVNVICTASIGRSEDCYKAYVALDTALLRGFRSCLRKCAGEREKVQSEVSRAGGYVERGAKWWVRYVFVPIFAAVLAASALFIRFSG